MLQTIANLGDNSGKTALYDSFPHAISLFGAPETGDAIYLISDGDDNLSKLREKDVERDLLARGIRLFCLIFKDRYFQTKDETSDVADVNRLAEATGGSSVVVWKSQSATDKGLDDRLLREFDLVRKFYELGVALPSNSESEHGWKLQVVDGNQKRRKNTEVTYPRSLFSCAAATPDPDTASIAK
jgi:hypothetical protein